MFQKIKSYFSQLNNYTLAGSPKTSFEWQVMVFRILAIAYRGFSDDHLTVRASALTYYTALSIVPVVALAFGIAKGFGFEAIIENQIRDALVGQQEVIDWIITFSRSMLETTKGGIVAGVGIVVLLYTVMNILSQIEESFNAIWNVHRPRTFIRKFTDYFSMTLLAPIMILLSSSATVFITTQFDSLSQEYGALGAINDVVFFFIGLAPYVLVFILFIVIFMALPNTRVKIWPAVTAAFLAAIGFQLVQWVYIEFQIGVSRYNAIYGSFAALPLFLIWMNISWVIVLIGAKIAYAIQHSERDLGVRVFEALPPSEKKKLCIIILREIIRDLVDHQDPITERALLKRTKIPSRILQSGIEFLTDLKLIAQVEFHQDTCYIPSKDINMLYLSTIHHLVDSWQMAGQNIESLSVPPSVENYFKALQEVKIDTDMLIKDLP